MSSDPLSELLALYRLVHADEIVEAKKSILGDGTRLAIYEACITPQTQAALASLLGVTPQAVGNHVRLLVDSGLLQVERDGRTHLYTQLL